MFNAIIMPIAKVLGYIFNLLFEALSFLHIGNVAVAIVLFTIIVKLCMLPLSIKQQKLTKLNAVMSPEIKAINAKYKDKRDDQNAMMKMQEETLISCNNDCENSLLHFLFYGDCEHHKNI